MRQTTRVSRFSRVLIAGTGITYQYAGDHRFWHVAEKRLKAVFGQIGRCIKAGGRVELQSYYEADRLYMDATLTWDQDDNRGEPRRPAEVCQGEPV